MISINKTKNHYAITPDQEWEDPVLAYVSSQLTYGFYEDDLIEAIDKKYNPAEWRKEYWKEKF